MSKIFNYAQEIHNKIFNLVAKFGSPLILLAIRLWIANIFFKSGLTRIGNMEQTILLFEYEYDLPILSPTVAAYSATFAELFFPIFLALGLLSRLAALPLFIMAIVIQTLVIQHPEHFYWMFLLANIMIFGGGKISADNFLPKICNKICKK